MAYGGDDPAAFESNAGNFLPKWMAYEMRLMAERYVSDGMVPEAGDDATDPIAVVDRGRDSGTAVLVSDGQKDRLASVRSHPIMAAI